MWSNVRVLCVRELSLEYDPTVHDIPNRSFDMTIARIVALHCVEMTVYGARNSFPPLPLERACSRAEARLKLVMQESSSLRRILLPFRSATHPYDPPSLPLPSLLRPLLHSVA